ncbi:MAG: hypothetical protein DMF61_25820 [Blastocatellia bacterium AA13]|nr:MAG: hypothetical protein DMF61_25820 [Blastocatellia bacterium AA13]
MSNGLLMTIDVSKRLGCSVELVRNLARSGRLPCETTPSGRRVYKASDVERLAAAREREKRERRTVSASN